MGGRVLDGGRVDNEDGLKDLFDDEPASDALIDWARHGDHGGTVRPVIPPWQPSGVSASGALLAAVLVAPRPGAVVVKVSTTDQADEGHTHARARRTAPDRVAPLLWTWPVGDGRVLTFQSPAGGSLSAVDTLSGLGGGELPDACAFVTKWLLTRWNDGLGVREPVPVSVGQLLRGELGALVSRGGSALAYGSRITGMRADSAWIRTDDQDLPNPLALATGHAELPDPALYIARGLAHGDLHLHNIMVPHREGSARYQDFQLIDLATFADDAPLSRDVAMLLLSALAPEAQAESARGGDALLRYLVSPHKDLLERIPPSTSRLVRAVGQTCARAAEGGLYDVWSAQFLLSLVATGLRFSTYENMGEAGRWWYFRLAAHAGGELLKPYEDRPRPAGRPVGAPVPLGPQAASAAHERRDRRSTPAARRTEPGRLSADRDATNPSEELLGLEAYSRAAVVAAGHQGASGTGAHPLDLTALAVPRDMEWSLLGLLGEGRSACVTGEPGTGKTTLLWRIHTELAADPAGPRPYFLRAGDLWSASRGAGPLLETVRAACRRLARPAVFLLDTADLLVSDTSGLLLLQELLTLAAEHSVRVLMTCRKEEARILRPYVGDFALEWKVLGPYSDREQKAAIRTHARYFYEGQSEVSVDEVCRTVTNAAVRGLPMREVCRAPLTLRMLFETFAPKAPLVEEIDATTLYDLYWEHRVGKDQRAGFDVPAPGAAPPPDLSESGEEVARLMLEEGRLDLSAAEVRTGLRSRSRSVGPVDDLQGLVARGVIERQGANSTERYSYFHQTLFEYAAGRRLSRTAVPERPSHLGHLLDWLKEHPDDHFRLAVAEQALVQAGRSGGRAAEASTALLTELLAKTWGGSPELHGLRAMQLRVYARLPAPDAGLRRRFGRAVADLPPVLGRVYLEALPTTCHRDRGRIVEELLGIWRRGHEELRQPLLVALKWLAESLPESVISVIDGACPTWARGNGPCRGVRCSSQECLWAWLLTRHKSEVFKFLAVLEALAPKRPDWVWPRLRTLMTDPHSDLLPMARCLRLAARRQDWPERPYPTVRPVVRHRWGRERPRNKDGFELQAALGRLTAVSWQTGAQPPSSEAVLAAAARRPEESMSYPQVRAVSEMAVQASYDEVARLLDVVEEAAGPAAMPLLTDHLLLPLLTAAQGTVDTIGGDTPSSRTSGAEPAATVAVRAWLARQLRALDRPGPVGFAHRLAEHTWSRDLDVVTTARLATEAWPQDDDPSGHDREEPGVDDGDEPDAEERLRRIWLSEQGAVQLLVAASAAGHPHARKALRLWRADRAGKGHAKGPARKQGVSQEDQKIALNLQRLVPEHPELLDELLAPDTIDPRLDAGWLNKALGDREADVDRRLTAALRRHADALERLCDVTWTGDYGSAAARSSFHLRGKLIVRGVLGPPSAGRLDAVLAARGHPHHVRSALLLVETVIDHSPNGTLDTEEWRRLEGRLRGFTHQDVRAVARRCLTGLVCRHHALDTPRRIAQAHASALNHLARATTVDEVTVLGRFVERLAEASPQNAVELVTAAAGRLRVLPTGQVMSLAQRWYRPLSRLAERASTQQWKELVEGVREGPREILRVLIRSGIRKRTDDPAAHLLAIADSSPWPDMIRETVRVGTLLHTESSRQRWLPSLDSVTEG
ncbi:ATP-binding protein [Streptomyces sp. NPDC047043]|uniref:ATP-binding protein n=1 Tax=Streptomyces sp. NPDC047043 TaxID=3154497 RepID=UPI0033DBFB0A